MFMEQVSGQTVVAQRPVRRGGLSGGAIKLLAIGLMPVSYTHLNYPIQVINTNNSSLLSKFG